MPRIDRSVDYGAKCVVSMSVVPVDYDTARKRRTLEVVDLGDLKASDGTRLITRPPHHVFATTVGVIIITYTEHGRHCYHCRR